MRKYPDDFIDKVICSDCLEVMKDIPDNSVDACVTDPPYGLEFMGKEWDKLTRNLMNPNSEADIKRKDEYGRTYAGRRSNLPYYSNREKGAMQQWHYRWACEVYRVLKPGAHLLAFGGSRTYHRMVCAVEDAGFEIRDQIMWVYGSGFPKSLDISKAIDKAVGAKREVVAENPNVRKSHKEHIYALGLKQEGISEAATPEAREWSGWGTALKPAHEPIVVARKPLSEKTVAENVLKWGTGGLNIDGCRIEFQANDDSRLASGGVWHNRKRNEVNIYGGGKGIPQCDLRANPVGRFPANFIHDGSIEVLELFPQTTSGKAVIGTGREGNFSRGIYGAKQSKIASCFGDSGSAARFFYCAKASKAERNRGGMENKHPTVKPIALMQYLVKLVTHEGQIVIDPFTGSGTTLIACKILRNRYIGIEIGSDYCKITEKRLGANNLL